MGSAKIKKKTQRRNRIRQSIRKKIEGTSSRPRMSIFRSNSEIYVQLVDDMQGHTLISASSRDKDIDGKGKTKTEISMLVGEKVANLAKDKNIDTVIFDRGGFLYHGRVKALAEGARKGGLNI
jgi:large subunit ribosomal protein L18